MKKYIHYGDDHFDPIKCVTAHRAHWAKPDKGVWASPIDSAWGWQDWCISEEYSPSDFDWNKSFTFTLDKDAKILNIRKDEDILNYIIKDNEIRFYPMLLTDVTDRLNLDKLYRDYDGMEVFMFDNYIELHSGIFNSWDCDSIVVWNPDVVIPDM